MTNTMYIMYSKGEDRYGICISLSDRLKHFQGGEIYDL